jgi:peroxidase
LFVFFILNENSSCLAIFSSNITRIPRQLRVDYYAKSCPQLEQLVGSVTSQQFKQSPVSGPATIRLLFHDCFVEVSKFDTIKHIQICFYLCMQVLLSFP